MTGGPPPPPPAPGPGPGPGEAPSYPPGQGGAPPYSTGQPGYAHPAAFAPAPPANPKAIVGLIAGLMWFCGVGSIVALGCGYSARGEITRSQGQQSGSGIAIAAIVLGWVGLTPYAFFFVFVVFGAVGEALGG